MNASTIRSEPETCPPYGRQADDAAAVCHPCGAQLPSDVQTRELDRVAEVIEPTPPPLGPSVPNEPIRLQIEEVLLPLPRDDDVILGRSVSQYIPGQTHLDLADFDAYESGVSRRHARITSRNERAYVLDLSSSNGTWLNGQRLIPFHEYLLHHGDELRLGLLKIKVRS